MLFFAEPKQALCGNGVVEEGEQCDCGWEEDCEEDCCWPQTTNHPPDQKPCTLRPKKDCSPSQGPCCNFDCSFKLGEKCLDDNGCRAESFCDGTAAACPWSQVRPNKTVCNKEFVCYKGECTGSICLAYGLESCQCEQGPDDSETKPCELCCKEPGEDKPCLSSFQLNESPYDVPDMFSKPGKPCNNYKGYCDVFQKCREVDPSGPLATLRKILLDEETLKRFLMRYWYIMPFIAVGVFILMAVIIKMCGKKTPLVRRRKRRRHTIQHGADNSDNPSQEANGAQVQVHPMAVEASVPLGKKVRKDRGGSSSGNAKKKRRVSKSTERSPQTSTTTTTPTSGQATSTVEDGVARAVRLAANLSNQLFVDLPPEATPAATSPTNENGDNRKSRGKHKKKPQERKHKSLSPEKRLASTLAQSMSSISKSFEKLDLIGHSRRVSRANKNRTRDELHATSSSGQKKHRKRSKTSAAPAAAEKQKEVTIAKLGRFKFSVEVAKSFEEEEKGVTTAATAGSGGSKSRKTSAATKETSDSSRPHQKESKVAKLPSIHVTNFNAQKTNGGGAGSATAAATSFNVPSVIVSKRRKERPRRENSPDKKASTAASNGLDYRKSFGARDKFPRSMSHPPNSNGAVGLAEVAAQQQRPSTNDLVDGVIRTKKNSFAHGQRPRALRARDQARKLRRSETERFAQRPNEGLWVPPTEFDNQAYDKSPEPIYQSLSLNSLNEGSIEAPSSSSSSTDNDLKTAEAPTAKPNQISRAKILETVGVLVNNVTAPPASSSSAANLLLPPSSSSPSSSSSVSLSGATSPYYDEAHLTASSEPRLAFIGCDTTSSTGPGGGGSGGHKLQQQASAKRPSLSERYPTESPCSTSSSKSLSDREEDSKLADDELDDEDTTEDNLDIISIITDGMN